MLPALKRQKALNINSINFKEIYFTPILYNTKTAKSRDQIN